MLFIPLLQIVGTLLQYWFCLIQFIFLKKSYTECTFFPQDTHARVQLFSLALIFRLWSAPHYRSPSFQQDMLDNLRNVAVPGTGIPLSWFCGYQSVAFFFVFMINPLVCFMGAVNKAALERRDDAEAFCMLLNTYFTQHLLHPDDWFSLWRLNCRLVSYHSLVTNSSDYLMEDKWTFLTQGKALNVPVSPYNDNVEAMVCKNKLIEGGMGIHFYKNAAFGGDWIIQEKLRNAAWLNDLLPHNAPLSTMRVITTSSFTLSEEYPLKQVKSLLATSSLFTEAEHRPEHVLAEEDNQTSIETNASDNSSGDANRSDLEDLRRYIRAESAVLRLGRANANTDHSCILFDVDVNTGRIQPGTTNAHWYQLGPQHILTSPWLPPRQPITRHLDAPHPQVTGHVVPHMDQALEIVISAHAKMMPEVPIVGWDVAFTSNGIYLLEVNLSCNFFRGSFDLPQYIHLIDRYWVQLEKMQQLNVDLAQAPGAQHVDSNLRMRRSHSNNSTTNNNSNQQSTGNNAASNTTNGGLRRRTNNHSNSSLNSSANGSHKQRTSAEDSADPSTVLASAATTVLSSPSRRTSTRGSDVVVPSAASASSVSASSTSLGAGNAQGVTSGAVVGAGVVSAASVSAAMTAAGVVASVLVAPLPSRHHRHQQSPAYAARAPSNNSVGDVEVEVEDGSVEEVVDDDEGVEGDGEDEEDGAFFSLNGLQASQNPPAVKQYKRHSFSNKTLSNSHSSSNGGVQTSREHAMYAALKSPSPVLSALTAAASAVAASLDL